MALGRILHRDGDRKWFAGRDDGFFKANFRADTGSPRVDAGSPQQASPSNGADQAQSHQGRFRLHVYPCLETTYCQTPEALVT